MLANAYIFNVVHTQWRETNMLNRRIGVRNVLAGVLSAVMVLSSCPATVLATDDGASEDLAVATQTKQSEETGFDLSVLEDQSALENSAKESIGDDVVTEETEEDYIINESGLIEDLDNSNTFSLENGIEEQELTIEEDEDLAEEDIAPGEESDQEILSAANEEDVLVEDGYLAASDEEVTAVSQRGFFYTYFSAVFDDETAVKVTVSNLFVGRGSTMQVRFVPIDDYIEKIEAQNYGKVVVGTKAIELAFFDSRGNEFKPIGLEITIDAKKIDAESYVLYRSNGNNVHRIGTSVKPSFDFYTSFKETYILTGVRKDDFLRTEGKRVKGKTLFKLSEGSADISVTAPSGAFYGDISMEAEMVSDDIVLDAVESVLEEDMNPLSITAYDISFHAGSEDEVEPNKDVTVTIKTPIDTDNTYKLIHIHDNQPASEVHNAVFDKDGVTFSSKEFSIFAIVEVNEDGSLHYEKTFGSSKVTVDAPKGTFERGTRMVLSDGDSSNYASILTVLDPNHSYDVFSINISFWKDGVEIEPEAPVEVTWESSSIEYGDTLVHVKDDGTAEKIEGAAISAGKAVFVGKSFSEYSTVHSNTVTVLDNIELYPSTLSKKSFNSGYIKENAPSYDSYSFNKAVIMSTSSSASSYDWEGDVPETDEVIFIGQMTATNKEDPSDVRTYVYYRTVANKDSSDLLIELLVDQKIVLYYDSTPLTVTYKVTFGGQTYTIADGVIPADLRAALLAQDIDPDKLIVDGPSSIKENTIYDNTDLSANNRGVYIAIPRGCEATSITRNGSNMGRLGVEPTYTSTRDTVTKTGTYELDGVFTIPSVTSNQEIIINLNKRNSYTYTVGHVLYTKYFGGGSTKRYRESKIDNENTETSKTFTLHESSWTFRTTTPVSPTPQDRNGYCWIMDSLAVNGEDVAVPYSETGTSSVSTTLSTGTIITITVTVDTSDSVIYNGKTYYSRSYTVKASNCYENITISGGNLYNSWSWWEYMPDVLENVTYDYQYQDTNIYNRKSTATNSEVFEHWPVSQPISIGNGSDFMNWYSDNRNRMRFRVNDGYEDPEMAFISSNGTDLFTSSNIYLSAGISKGTSVGDNYYKINGNPDNSGYYKFSINSLGNNTFAMLRIRAYLKRYAIQYGQGDHTWGDKYPVYNNGGKYGDGTVRGFNVEDNTEIVIDKTVPTSSDSNYVFLYYTIEGASQDVHYAPSQKIELNEIMKYASSNKNSEGLYEIKFIAHWEEREVAPDVAVTAHFILDDVERPEAEQDIMVPKNGSVYVDIDSETLAEFMTKYDWQLFFDEEESEVFIMNIQENAEVTLRFYSKFYVYNSGTDTLELHTTKEAEKGTGDGRYIDTIDFYKYHNDDYLYGGVYKAYDDNGKVQHEADENNKHGTLTIEEIKILSKADEGVVIKENVGSRYVPQLIDNNWAGPWTWDDGYSVTDMEPVPVPGSGPIYYIKEVPTGFLQNYIHYIYDWNTKELVSVYPMSAIDDANYQSVGLVFTDVESENIADEFGPMYRLCKSLDFTPSTYSQSVGAKPIIISATDKYDVGAIRTTNVFEWQNVKKGYLAIWKSTTVAAITNCKFRVQPYWTTKDGRDVYGVTSEINTGDCTIGDGGITITAVNG